MSSAKLLVHICFIFLFPMLVVGCGSDCPQQISSASNAPVIKSIHMVSQDIWDEFDNEQHNGSDPWIVLLQIDFSDQDGDFGEGKIYFYSDGEEIFVAECERLFRQRGIQLDTVAESLGIALRVEPNKSSGSGSFALDLSVQPEDASGKFGACKRVTLSTSFTIE